MIARGSQRSPSGEPVNVEVFIGGAPQLELKLVRGLLEFGRSHPAWRFALRGPGFRCTAGWLRRQRIAGMLVLIDPTPVARALEAAGVPWVHLLPRRPVPHPAINLDNRAIGRLGAEFFLEHGYSRLAFCGIGTGWGALREAGFRDRLAQEGLPCRTADVPFETDKDWVLRPRAEAALQRWVARLERHTAVMAAQDIVANRLVDLCLQHGHRIPEDIAVLGAGNHDLLCTLGRVPISSVETGVPEAGIRAAEMLESLIRGRKTPGTVVVPPAGVVERRSTAAFAFDDERTGRIVAHIRDRVCDGLAVEDLAASFHMSRRTLVRRFAEQVGHSPGEEIRRARLCHARRMIVETRRPLTEIAQACGYSDHSHMDRAFRALLGRRPGSLRRETAG
jgi:LacI family transcriptional regulator